RDVDRLEGAQRDADAHLRAHLLLERERSREGRDPPPALTGVPADVAELLEARGFVHAVSFTFGDLDRLLRDRERALRLAAEEVGGGEVVQESAQLVVVLHAPDLGERLLELTPRVLRPTERVEHATATDRDECREVARSRLLGLDVGPVAVRQRGLEL